MRQMGLENALLTILMLIYIKLNPLDLVKIEVLSNILLNIEDNMISISFLSKTLFSRF